MFLTLLAVSQTAWIIGGSILAALGLSGAAVYYFLYYRKK